MEEKKIERNNPGRIRMNSWIEFLLISASVIILSVSLSILKFRIDLTGDRRFSLSEPTKKILSELRNDLYIQVWLDGDMPVQFKKLKRSVKDILDEFRIASGRKVGFEFINPSQGDDARERNSRYESLISSGLVPVNIQSKDEEGGASQKIIFPGMTVNYNGVEIPVNFLKNNQLLPPEQNLLNSIEGLEYEIIQTISTITSDSIYKIAFIEGHDEISEIETADITIGLSKYFTIDRGIIGGRPGILDKYSAIVIAGPQKPFDEKDKLVIDQYIMNGGKVLWLYEEVNVNEDSLVSGETMALYTPLNIGDQLFRYGVRVNPSVVQDLECMLKPFNVISGGTRQQVVPVPWLYYPLLTPSSVSPVTRNINRVLGRYVNYIDTVGRDPGISKTVLLSSSRTARTINPPVLINLRDARETPDEKLFSKSSLPVAVMLSGRFRSAFTNRIVPGVTDGKDFKMREIGEPSKMIVVADCDIIRNEVRRVGNNVTPLPLGQDRYTLQTFGNKDFVVNCINSLVDDNGLMELRSREIKLRLLDKTAIRNNKSLIITINIAVPVLLVIIAGFLYSILRRRMYSIKVQ
jgi:gliding-associated putative ABC transporter substrate-binding component GldG